MRRLVAVGKFAVAAALIYWLFSSGKVSLRDLGQFLGGWHWLLLAQPLLWLVINLTVYRWRLLLDAQGIRIRFRRALRISFIGFFFNQFIPGSTGGDVVKAYYIAVDSPGKRAEAATTVFLDRVVGLLALALIAAIAILVNWSFIAQERVLRVLAGIVLCVIGGGTVVLAVFFSERIRGAPWIQAIWERLPLRSVFGRISQAVYLYKFNRWLLVRAAVLSVMVHLSVVGMNILFALAGGADEIPVAKFFFLAPLAHLAASIPVSPGGLGVLEVAYAFLFERAGLSYGGSLAIIWRVNWIAWSLAGAGFYLGHRTSWRGPDKPHGGTGHADGRL